MVDPLGGFLVLFGLIGAIWPYEVARLEERFDSIGSKRSWSQVEPADWKVAITRYSAIAMVAIGLFLLFSPSG